MLKTLWSLVLPTTCPGCQKHGYPVCLACEALLQSAPTAPPPVGVDAWAAPFAYEGVARKLITQIKYQGGHSASEWLAQEMLDCAPARQSIARQSLLITWAPTTRARRRGRGFDQAEVLARAVGKRMSQPTRSVLRRSPGPPQTGLSGADRRNAPSFSVVHPVSGLILLIDDVATTGATLSAAAKSLKKSGATRVVALTAARTPARPNIRSSGGSLN